MRDQLSDGLPGVGWGLAGVPAVAGGAAGRGRVFFGRVSLGALVTAGMPVCRGGRVSRISRREG